MIDDTAELLALCKEFAFGVSLIEMKDSDKLKIITLEGQELLVQLSHCFRVLFIISC